MRRGDIRWIAFPQPIGHRPAILVSRDEAYGVRAAITIVPLTRTKRGIPVEVPLGPDDGVPHSSVANADNITTIPKRRVGAYLTALSPTKRRALDDAIRFALDLH